MNAASTRTRSTAGPVHRPRRLWLWFVGGFLLVFVGMLLLAGMIAMHPSGQYAVQYPLWQYYAVMVPRLFGTAMIGPASGGTGALVETAVLHLLFSIAGGFLAAAMGCWLSRSRN